MQNKQRDALNLFDPNKPDIGFISPISPEEASGAIISAWRTGAVCTIE